MALNITPPIGHLAANFAGLPQQIGLLGAGAIPTTGLLGPFTPMNLPDYTGDLPTSAFDVTSYVEKYKEDQKKKSDQIVDGNFDAEGGADNEGYGLATFGPNSYYAGDEMYGAYSGQLSHAQLAAKMNASGFFPSKANKTKFHNAVVSSMQSVGISPSHSSGGTTYSAEDFRDAQVKGAFKDWGEPD